MSFSDPCTRCGAPRNSPISCDQCREIFPVSAEATYFDLLGLPRRFELDESELTHSYRDIARRIHPDRFVGDDEHRRLLATQLSAEVNQAHRVLRQPVSRADYLLNLAGGPSCTEVREVTGTFLEEVMTLREEIEQARARGDGGSLDAQRQSIQQRRADALRQIAAVANRIDTASREERTELRKQLNSVKYLDNLLTELAVDPLALPAT